MYFYLFLSGLGGSASSPPPGAKSPQKPPSTESEPTETPPTPNPSPKPQTLNSEQTVGVEEKSAPSQEKSAPSREEQAKIDQRKNEIIEQLEKYRLIGVEGTGADDEKKWVVSDQTRQELLAEDLGELEESLAVLYETNPQALQEAKSKLIAETFPNLTDEQRKSFLSQLGIDDKNSLEELKIILRTKNILNNFADEAKTPAGMKQYLIDQEIAVNGGTREEAAAKLEKIRQKMGKLEFFIDLAEKAVEGSDLKTFIDNFLSPSFSGDFGAHASRESGYKSDRNITGAEFESKLKSGGEFTRVAMLAALEEALGENGLSDTQGLDFEGAQENDGELKRILHRFNEKARVGDKSENEDWNKMQKGLSLFYSSGKNENYTFDDSIKYLFQDMQSHLDKYIK